MSRAGTSVKGQKRDGALGTNDFVPYATTGHVSVAFTVHFCYLRYLQNRLLNVCFRHKRTFIKDTLINSLVER